jgi:hypothetical protein
LSRPIASPRKWPDVVEATLWRRVWAAVMLTRDDEVCLAILRGLPVIARQLDAEALRRALRGAPLPPADTYVRLDAEHLDAVAEAGPLAPREAKRR